MITKKSELSDVAIWRCHSLWRTRHPGELKDMVTSPGGTTIEGCEALEKKSRHACAVIECINVSQKKKNPVHYNRCHSMSIHTSELSDKEELSTVSRG